MDRFFWEFVLVEYNIMNGPNPVFLEFYVVD